MFVRHNESGESLRNLEICVDKRKLGNLIGLHAVLHLAAAVFRGLVKTCVGSCKVYFRSSFWSFIWGLRYQTVWRLPMNLNTRHNARRIEIQF